MTRSPKLYLQDIIECSELIAGFIVGHDREQFKANVMMQFAVIRAMGIIGDAAKKLPPEFRKRHPEIPWREMAQTRDVLIHDYLRINLDSLWRTITTDLPPLADKLRPLLEE